MATAEKIETGLTKGEVRVSLTAYNWNISLRAIFEGVCGINTFVYVAFALALGLPKEKMGLVSTAVGVACLAQILSLFIVNYTTDRKAYVVTLAFIEPLVVLVAVVLAPYMPPSWRIVFLIVAAFVGAAFLHLTSPFVAEWLASTVPPGLRGRFLGRRFQVQQMFMAIAILASGFILEKIGRANVVGMSLLLAGGTVFGILAVLMLNRVSLPANSVTTTVSWASIKEVLRHRPFRLFLLAFLLIELPFYLACPYYQVFNLEVVRMRETHIAYMMALYTVVKITALPLWGKICDRGHMRAVAYASTAMYVIFFVAFPFTIPGRTWPLFLAWGLAGLADAAYSVWPSMLLYNLLPASSARPAFFAILSVITVGLVGLGALCAVPILEYLKNIHLAFGGVALSHFHAFYIGIGIAMFFCAFGVRIYFIPVIPFSPSAAPRADRGKARG